MAHKRSRKRPAQISGEVQMTPMIDIVFQLLIYFILTFEPMDVMANLDVFRPSPEAQQEKPKDPPNVLRVTIYEDGFTINDRTVGMAEMERVLFRLAGLDRNQTVLIMATAHSRHENLIAVLDLCAKTGLRNLSVVSMN